MKREYWERLGLERELINLIMAENGRDIEALRAQAEALTAERDALAAKLAESDAERNALTARLAGSDAERVRLEGELATLRSAGGGQPGEDAQKAFEAALEAVSSEYAQSLERQKAEYESALAAAEEAAQKKLEEALASQKAAFETELAEYKRRAQIEELFAGAGFACALAREAAVARFLGEGGTPETAGEWLSSLRAAEPTAFTPHDAPADLPRFTVETPAAEDGEMPAGGLLSAVLKKLR
jgi:hypothetical protein